MAPKQRATGIDWLDALPEKRRDPLGRKWRRNQPDAAEQARRKEWGHRWGSINSRLAAAWRQEQGR